MAGSLPVSPVLSRRAGCDSFEIGITQPAIKVSRFVVRASTAARLDTNGHIWLVGPQRGLVVVVAVEGVAGDPALVDPARLVEVAEVDQHPHGRAGGHRRSRGVSS